MPGVVAPFAPPAPHATACDYFNYSCSLKSKKAPAVLFPNEGNRYGQHILSWMLQLPTTISMQQSLTRYAKLFFYMAAEDIVTHKSLMEMLQANDVTSLNLCTCWTSCNADRYCTLINSDKASTILLCLCAGRNNIFHTSVLWQYLHAIDRFDMLKITCYFEVLSTSAASLL